MIDWFKTKEIYGYGEEILSSKRPKVIFLCDQCGKSNKIQVRQKNRLINNQIFWLCPSCVKLKDSNLISNTMKNLWANNQYREHQNSIKSSVAYKTKQSIASIRRWENKSYRDKLHTGINKKEYISKFHELYGDSYDFSDTQFRGWHDKIELRCNKCDQTLNKDPQKHLIHGYCQYCGITKGQKQITDYIKSLGLQYLVNDRLTLKNSELDIFIPSHKVAIEYHGLYWHSYNRSESKEEKERHQRKAINCLNYGIKLLQFFDFEWDNKRNIVESMIRNSLAMSTKLNAREMQVISISDKEANEFFTSNHLLGYRNARLTLALADDDNIHCAMSFSKTKDGNYEIIRMASRLNEIIRGGSSKLISHFRTIHSGKLYSFADLRYSNGNSYEKLGFNKLKITHPGYFYSKQSHNHYMILSRQQCQKRKLPKILGSHYISHLSESQNMFNSNFRRAWTAGNILYVKDLSKS